MFHVKQFGHTRTDANVSRETFWIGGEPVSVSRDANMFHVKHFVARFG